MKTAYNFPCGCTIPIDLSLPAIHNHPSLIYPDDIEDLRLDCPVVYETLSRGSTKGVFQLESPLGRQWTKRLQPGIPNPEDGIEHMTALGALLRPGCVSQDTRVAVKQYPRKGRRLGLRWITISELYKKFKNDHCNYVNAIISLNESNNLLFCNTIEDVIYSGKKEVYQPFFSTKGLKHKFYNLECTLDHKLLTLHGGWRELKDLCVGEYVAVSKCKKEKLRPIKLAPGEKSFRDICATYYEYRCIFCDWCDGSLDVNHIDGNRKSNNEPGNLCYMCPNHHRMYTEHTITKDEVLKVRKTCELPHTNHIEWRMYMGKSSKGVKDTYDITVKGPNHNFIAGNVVVHNCLKAKDEDGISMTEHYCRRKNGEEDVTYFHPALEPILKTTYGVLTYQEQAMAIAVALANFTPQEADDLRKAMGKKLTDVMAKVKIKFMEKAGEAGIVTPDEAAQIFGWIEKSQRYSFNRSHAVSYALIGYHTAHFKAHFPLQFYTSWLYEAKEKQDPLLEIRQLINDAKAIGIEILPPRFEDLNAHFSTDGVIITFGLSDVKGIGPTHITKLRENVKLVEREIETPRIEWSWYDFLIHLSPCLPSTVVERMIEVGAMRKYRMQRQKMLAEYRAIKDLTKKEQYTLSRLTEIEKDEHGLFLPEPRKITELTEGLERLLMISKGVANKNRREKVGSIINILKNPLQSLVDTADYIAKTEEACLGVAITCTAVEDSPNLKTNITCKEFRDGKNMDCMVFAVDIQECQEHRIQNGKNRGKTMAFLVISDKTGSIDDVCMFSEAWKKYGHFIYPGNTIEVRGHRDPARGSFIVEEAWKI